MVKRFWIIRADHNEVYVRYRSLSGKTIYWTRDEGEAERFATQDGCVAAIVATFNGKGRALEVIEPAVNIFLTGGRPVAALVNGGA